MIAPQKKTIWTYIQVIAILTVVVFFTFQGLDQSHLWFDGYDTVSDTYSNPELIKDYIIPSIYGGFHYNPLGAPFRALLFMSMGLNAPMHMIVAQLMHIAASFVVFLIARKLFKQPFVALFVASLFAISAVNYETIAWPSTYSNSIAGPSMAMLAFLFFLNWSETKKKKWFRLSLIFSIIAPLFLESTVVIFVLIPFYHFLFNTKFSVVKTLKKTWGFLLACGLYLGIRIGIQALGGESNIASSGGAMDLMKDYSDFWLWMFPAHFVSIDYILELATKFKEHFVGFYHEQTPYRPIASLLSVSMLAPLFIAGFTLTWSKFSNLGKRIIYFTLFTLVCGLPFLAMGRKFFTPISGRLYYLGLLGVVLLAGSLLYFFAKVFWSKTTFKKNTKLALLAVMIILLFIPILTFNRNYIQARIDKKNTYFARQEEIFDAANEAIEELPDKAIIFLTSNAPHRYKKGFWPEFQYGPGFILLLQIAGNDPDYYPIYQHKGLGGVDAERYDPTASGGGYGLVKNYDKLVEEIELENIPIENVFAISYPNIPQNGYEAEGINVSEKIRQKLRTDLAEKKEITASYKLSANENNKDISKIADGDKKTGWQSENPYSLGQTINIDFVKETSISSIDLVYTGAAIPNSFAGGYEVEACKLNDACQVIYQEYNQPANENGLVHMSFKNDAFKSLSIKQIGWHGNSKWEISEIKMYETAE